MKPHFGLIGLGTMGAALALNIVDNGFGLAVYNRTTKTTDDFMASAGKLAQRLVPAKTLAALVESIEAPRSIILMVPAGPVVDAQIEALAPLLGPDDVIIDAGNANFHDTNRRAEQAVAAGRLFFGLGVSGGEEGARFGPSMMAGGPAGVYERLRPLLETIAAKDPRGLACVDRMGESGAGHFVKMVHNGIEYADMQMIAEVYGILRDGHNASAEQVAGVFERFNQGPLASYLIEISGKVSRVTDADSAQPLLDMIVDAAGQKGTGRWTAIEAQQMGTAIPVIEAGVAARNVSAQLAFRQTVQSVYGAAPQALDPPFLEQELESALLAGKVICYAQGFAMMAAAKEHYGWSLPLPRVAQVWRAGCIIRSELLEPIADAMVDDPTRNLILAPVFVELLKDRVPALRRVVTKGLEHGIPVTALAAALGWFDMARTGRSTANMLQAQRDFFGAHGFGRTDREGEFHGPWAQAYAAKD